ncbi:unnamed protein product [Clonostachys solani]|uniref:Rieske domain-containing protein n=1 Tax=Clonostachys solani TaxID=160281 RepID=A0A9N9Z8F3_9HYPO|nr:unnamed protein product [Clonostachys solani]
MAQSRPDTSWHFVGQASAFPNVTSDKAGSLTENYPCGGGREPEPDSSATGCKVFFVPEEKDSDATLVDLDDPITALELKNQVLIFQYNGKFHAVDHKCPHSSFPLSQGTPFDIEDFGVVLSAGIQCPKHGWSFDLFTGMADRSAYKLTIWELQLRPETVNLGQGENNPDQGIWVRKKPRMG